MIKEEIADVFRKKRHGRMFLKEPLSRHTSFGIGGPCDLWAEPADTKELKRIVSLAKANALPLFVVGFGSNILVSDKGVAGIVVHLGSPYFKKIKSRGVSIIAGAGASVEALVAYACSNGLGGLESLVGIPGSIGGAVYMNAGGSSNPIFKNIGDFVTTLKVMDYDGNIKILKRSEIEFGYRRTNLKPYLILEVNLRLLKEDSDTLKSRRAQFLNMKREKQALDAASAGCVFKNPDGFQFTCGQMIDMLGLKGRKSGGAEVSTKHANFIVNRGKASFDDVMKLIDLVKEKVKESYNISLDLEIKVIG